MKDILISTNVSVLRDLYYWRTREYGAIDDKQIDELAHAMAGTFISQLHANVMMSALN